LRETVWRSQGDEINRSDNNGFEKLIILFDNSLDLTNTGMMKYLRIIP